VSGGSSSGSAVVVADGTVAFALATDTAGSGRIPAAFNGIVGLKATLGTIGTRGVVPACRSLDCVSLLTGSVADAGRLLDVAAGFDPLDPYSRRAPPAAAAPAATTRVVVPRADEVTFCGDRLAAAAWQRALSRAHALGWEVTEIDFAPFAEAARLLYDGPWISERFASIGQFLVDRRRQVDPIVRRVVMTGRDHSAVDAHRAAHRLAELRRRSRAAWEEGDALMLPTAPTIFTAAEIADEPIVRNALLGTYTNFVNLLDLCAIAVPGGARDDGLPFGISLIAPAGADRALLALSADLSGEPLNGQLLALGARLVETVASAPGYRLYALPDTVPAKPGMVGGGPPGAPGIELEVWELSIEAFGRLVAGVPPPLVIGTVVLADGRAVKGFLCEAAAVAGAREITSFGGWRAYRASLERTEAALPG
jgi:allophanate hydrolase